MDQKAGTLQHEPLARNQCLGGRRENRRFWLTDGSYLHQRQPPLYNQEGTIEEKTDQGGHDPVGRPSDISSSLLISLNNFMQFFLFPGKNMWRLSWHYLLLCLFLLDLNFQAISSSSYNFSSRSIKLCSHEQSSALLHFKSTLKIHSPSYYPCGEYHYPKIDSWKEGSDCCSWDGVTCDSYTGHVIGLDLSSSWIHGTVNDNSSLFLLHNLQNLKLACNDFSESTISSKFGQFTKLTHLNLSFPRFHGVVPTEIFHLSKLVLLDLSGGFSLRLPLLHQHVFGKHLQNLTKLRYLHLDEVDLSLVAPGSLLNLSSTLISLLVGYTSLQGRFPNDVFRLPFLQKLSLTRNEDLRGDLSKSNWSSSLRFLDLSDTSFSGQLPDTNSDLIYLNVLDLHGNEFTGSIPTSLWNCTYITSLDLSGNNFTGEVAMSLSKLSQLRSLDLSGNSFSRQIPDVFGNLSKLTYLDLSFNNFNGQLPSSAFNLPQLSVLRFSKNQFEGHIPYQVSGLSNLLSLGLSNNFLDGRVPSWLFTLPSLETVDLTNKNSQVRLRGSISLVL
ncbi:receptor-like protein 9DC3 [Pistacia vera]|uniref:receptor-like protein 9DC3 n=1 Tax=Pistacia vera TaxID=55513 RepID=UPI001262CED6|nr:receptor-like protein 9DC3 [Pistacia vera]